MDEKAQSKLAEIHAKAHGAVILCLGDKVLREVSKESTAASILAKLEDLYLTKSLANRLCMKQRLYSYKFEEERGICVQLEEFDKAVDDLENIDVSIGDEDKAILLLNALPKSYDHLRDATVYGREKTISLLEVQSALRAKELQKDSTKMTDPIPESLYIKKFKKSKFKKKFEDSKMGSSYQKETRSFHWCKKPGTLKRDCFAWKMKQESESKGQSSADCAEEMESSEILNVTDVEIRNAWIMDSGCSFHMCPNKEWFCEMEQAQGSVLLGNNHICKIRGIGKIKMRMEDGFIKILSEVRFIPDIKRNLISLGSLELKGCSFESAAGKMNVSRKGKSIMTAERR